MGEPKKGKIFFVYCRCAQCHGWKPVTEIVDSAVTIYVPPKGQIPNYVVDEDEEMGREKKYDNVAVGSEKKYDVVVVGSCIEDLISHVPRFPGPGQTITGCKLAFNFGGKGANQAIMAARLSARTAMVGKVGKDVFGEMTLTNFMINDIDAGSVGMTNEVETATANITVEDSGQKSKVVVLGANLLLSVDDVRKAESKIASSKVVVCQLEVKKEVTLEALKLAKKHGVTTIFNPAPCPQGGLTDEFFKYSDILCPNESEAELLAGTQLKSDEDFDRALKQFLARGAKTVIITLGEKGCVFATANHPEPTRVAAPEMMKPIDTTGAGDAFVGSLSYFTACHEKLPLKERIHRSCRIASNCLRFRGSQLSYKSRNALPRDLFD